ncbi:acetylcholine receptor subunit beta-like [Haliotis rubra]|uniref:acetylcholine receptor subunit beta-like n=1 Tax=Haliotis rubra TaxID=36100 RepID=UPI001EE5B5B7|nr:acetylcholine receptor subunit beta-like [Haliotis rubra]
MLFFIVGIYCGLICVEGSSMEASLHQQIFKNYNKHVLPGEIDEAVNVSVDVKLSYLVGLDEKHQMLSLGMYFNITWVDEALSWNETEFPGLQEIIVPDKQIWLPQIAIPSAIRTNRYLTAVNYPVSIQSNGTVIWIPDYTGNIQCPIDTTRFPFDSQTCLFDITLWVYKKKHAQIVKSKGHAESTVKQNGQWEINTVESNLVTPLGERNYIAITLDMHRRREYYLVSIILPTAVTSCLNPFVFLLPAESGEKVGLATTLMLFYYVMLSHIFDNIPANSLTMPVFGIFIGGQLVLSGLSVVCIVVLLKLSQTNRDVAKIERSEDGNTPKINCLWKRIETILFCVFAITGIVFCGTVLILVQL